MISLKEIREKYQRPHYEAKKMDSWMSKWVYSNVATPIVWLLLPTSVTANQVTIFWVLLGVFSCFLFTLNIYWVSVLASLLIQLHIALDYVDGPIARIRKSTAIESKKGLYIERIGHDFIYTIYFFCIALGAVKIGFNPVFILTMGFSASVGYFFYKYTRRARIYCTLIYDSKDESKKNISVSEYNAGRQHNKKSRNILKYIYRKSQPLWDPVWFTVITLVFALFNLAYVVVIFYGITYPIQFLLSYYYQAKIKDDWVYQWLKNQD